jgi:nitrite reductase/ring-hydroxylating ferredoxin subunit
MWQEVARLEDVAPGGLKYVKAGGRELCLCNYGGQVYAVSRRCGHQNAPLDQGALDGWVLTCPLHDAQFDIRSGKNLAWPLDRDYGDEELPASVRRFFALERRLSWKIQVHDLHTYPARVVDGAVEVDLPQRP